MPTKAHGPLQEDYKRLIREAKRAGAPAVVVYIGGTPVVIPLNDTYLEKLALGQPPAPLTTEERKEVKLVW
jgi:hypothetical protein